LVRVPDEGGNLRQGTEPLFSGTGHRRRGQVLQQLGRRSAVATCRVAAGDSGPAVHNGIVISDPPAFDEDLRGQISQSARISTYPVFLRSAMAHLPSVVAPSGDFRIERFWSRRAFSVWRRIYRWRVDRIVHSLSSLSLVSGVVFRLIARAIFNLVP
jgi:hypothetical protein